MHDGAAALRRTDVDDGAPALRRTDVADGASALRRTDAYRYELPSDLIATAPATPADTARLLCIGSNDALAHRSFVDLPDVLCGGDVLVINETRVIRARLHGTRVPGGGAAEILLLRPALGGPFDAAAREWHALVRPGRKLRTGACVQFAGAPGDRIVGRADIVATHEDGTRTVRFDAATNVADVMKRCGELPLPPYVGAGDAVRAARYQTVFARVPGSVAAPTASLHFTPRVLAAIARRDVAVVPLVLDVGLGTFKPMDGKTIDEHVMHAERYAISAQTARAVNAAKRDGRRVVAAGTTVLRALEASAAGDGVVHAGEAETRLFVGPGYPFRIVDALLTNFHLPASTLLVLVTTFGGYETIMNAYRAAIAERYRFYSFGDATFVLRAGSQRETSESIASVR